MRTKSSLILAATLAAVVAAPAAAGPGNSDAAKVRPGSQSDVVTEVCNDESGDTITLDGPTLIWPPNHKLVDVAITMTDVDDEGEVMFGTMSSHDEIMEDGTEMNGSGNTAEDAVDVDGASGSPSATATLQVRAERSGQGDGRVYTVEVSGTAGDDDCSSTFELLVPHDMRPSNRVKPTQVDEGDEG